MAPRGDHRSDAEGRRSTQDRAHIMRIGDLIEHEHNAGRVELLKLRRGQGIGFGQ